jgi:hypothetical protein
MTRAIEDKVIDQNPLADLKAVTVPRRANVKPRFLSPAEAERLHAALIERDVALLDRRESGHRWKIEREYIADKPLPVWRFGDYLHPMVIVSLNTGIRRNELFL